jgi:hypothetical protein
MNETPKKLSEILGTDITNPELAEKLLLVLEVMSTPEGMRLVVKTCNSPAARKPKTRRS